ncbi:hypothetical protein JW968_03410 [Candidatus Woesearchaeota archaeon]|nr:hypothetical protein [Candidatus Woesearchaeota archaeon]
MKLVVDANPIISMLIAESPAIDIIFDKRFEIFAPRLILDEISRNMGVIRSKSRLSNMEQIFRMIKNEIQLVPSEEYECCVPDAEQICPDPKDIAYFALALHLGCGIWSNEKWEQNLVRVYMTHELISMI